MFNKRFGYLFLSYFALRLFSFSFNPETPLWPASPVNGLVTLLIIILAVYWLCYNEKAAIVLIAGEFILGGAGGFLALAGLSLRTWFLILTVSIFLGKKLLPANLKKTFFQAWPVSLALCGLLLAGLFGAIRGYFNWHAAGLVASDFLPYLFLLYFFPLQEWWRDEKFKLFVLDACFAAALANALFVLATFALYSANLFILQDVYYHWWRDVALGKITTLPFNYFRLVLNEHLLLVPLILYYVNNLIKKSKDTRYKLAVPALLIVLATNLTRIYILALGVGLIFLFSRQFIKRWLFGSIGTIMLLVLIFTTLHLGASRGRSLGFELFGLRLQSVVTPQIEDSALSRVLLLPKILNKIKIHPLIGTGLGDTVTVYSPIFKEDITTPHFDWGYLEIWAELGLLGLAAWGFYLLVLLQKIRALDELKLWWAILSALLVVNLTSPALFHVLGIVLLTSLSAWLYSKDHVLTQPRV
ncbi:MAG: O-antigen ligase family protein [Candidatus Magasanikbacteria bacterium]|nr:O-antigen ligase family protein [Candidatus Magasanikbacteria bacterium]